MVRDPLDILVVTTFGLEAVAVRELAALGYDGRGHGTGRVIFRGDALAVARTNVRLRTADRVLIRVASFECGDFDTLFEATMSIAWEEWIPADFTFPVSGRSVRSRLSSVPACQRTVKKAIVERLMKAHRVTTLPETGPKVCVEVSLLHDVATLTIDTSGPGLHKRGYRIQPGEAAIKETLAAGLVLLSVWKPDRLLADPFCGTGTIAIEAAMIGRNIAPGLRRSFDAELWSSIDRRLWREAREEALALPRAELAHPIRASDIDERALALARRAAASAGVEADIEFACRPFEDFRADEEYGCIITNPPYGVRMGSETEIERLYGHMPLVFRRLPTWSFHVLTGRLDLEDILGQNATRRRKFYTAKVEAWYFQFLGPRPAYSAEVGKAVEGAGGTTEDIGKKGHHGGAPGVTNTALARIRTGPNTTGAPVFGGLRERDVREVREFGACLAANARHLRRYPARGITCYRVYERDQVDVPLIIDVYEGWAHVAEYEREHSRTPAQQTDWWDAVKSEIARALAIPEEHVVIKPKPRRRGGVAPDPGDVNEALSGEPLIVHEGGLRFEVRLRGHIDTGLFLDHRLTRGLVRGHAGGMRFLNLFCYTGAFTVYAAAGGAASTTSVDRSNTYLAWARRNLELNGLSGATHRLVRAETMRFLREHPPGDHYDLCVIDPPTFSNSKASEDYWDVQRDHAEAIRRTLALLSPGGVIYFSTNARRFHLDEAAIADAGASVREISRQTVPPEYRNRRVHRCWRIRKEQAGR
jgi:23S rRNA (guanine2445-N2)-methyltransferase / 23S rRNA (guanine2069-N7)-methyltransferase